MNYNTSPLNGFVILEIDSFQKPPDATYILAFKYLIFNSYNIKSTIITQAPSMGL